jgi:hypothetical protein
MDSYTATRPFRFFDNREKYLLFVTTCSEKWVIAERVGMELTHLRPVPPALRVFDAGMGDATVLSQVMRQLHHHFPTIPFLIVGKEISQEDVRISLEKMADRFYEHPQTVLVITNLLYGEAPWLSPRSAAMQAKLNWWEVPLQGTSAYEFDRQIKDLQAYLRQGWQTTTSKRTGNPIYVTPSVLILYRADHKFVLGSMIPQPGQRDHAYDLVLASQPFRARLPAEIKVRNVLAPLASSLAPGGRMLTIQSTGKDPGMEIIRKIWPDENPFQTPRRVLLKELRTQLADSQPDLRYHPYSNQRAAFSYAMHMHPAEVSSTIGTSTLLAAWNAVIYVAQIEDDRLHDAMSRGDYLQATQEVLQHYQALWFTDESFVVTRQYRHCGILK